MKEFAKRKRRRGPPGWGPGGGAREAEPGLRPSRVHSRSGPGAWGGSGGFGAVATVSVGLAPDHLFRLWVALGPRAWRLSAMVLPGTAPRELRTAAPAWAPPAVSPFPNVPSFLPSLLLPLLSSHFLSVWVSVFFLLQIFSPPPPCGFPETGPQHLDVGGLGKDKSAQSTQKVADLGPKLGSLRLRVGVSSTPRQIQPQPVSQLCFLKG